jgi:hypothetical protein
MKTRNILALVLLLAVPVLFISCEQVKNLASVSVSYTIPSIPFTYVPNATKSGEVILCQEQVNLNIDSLITKYLPGGSLDETEFTTLSITIAQPDTANFAWLQSARATVSDNPNFTTETQIGNVTNIDPLNKTVSLTMNNDNIRPLLGTQGFYIRVYGTLTGPVPYAWLNMYIDGTLKLDIQAL